MRRSTLVLLILVLVSTLLWAQSTEVQFIFTTDSHYGISRPAFRGATNVEAHTVNAAMVASINRLARAGFPADGGLRSGGPVGPVDFLVDGGDIANREEADTGIQSAATSWSQFRSDYINGLTLLNRVGKRTPVYAVPGNHDASKAVGYYKRMASAIDKTSMVEIYNLMMTSATPKTAATYDYAEDKVLVSHDVGGIHFVYLTIWPDSRVRAWMEKDLKAVSNSTPVILFAHVSPEPDPKMFRNPNGKGDISEADKFENLLADTFTGRSTEATPIAEGTAWEGFLRQHPNITAYFHGHSNWNQFYDWTGPNHTVMLHTFRADSPMKGHFSGTDETKLSFQIATIDTVSRTMTVREVLWNANPQHPDAPLTWGASTTVALAPRPPAAK
jgi:predicted MPP superfamily phosphohydrolase